MLLEVFLLKINIVKKSPIIIIIIIVKRNGLQLHTGLLLFYLCIHFYHFHYALYHGTSLVATGGVGCSPLCQSSRYHGNFSTSPSRLPLQEHVDSSLCVLPHFVWCSCEIWQTPHTPTWGNSAWCIGDLWWCPFSAPPFHTMAGMRGQPDAWEPWGSGCPGGPLFWGIQEVTLHWNSGGLWQTPYLHSWQSAVPSCPPTGLEPGGLHCPGDSPSLPSL